MLTSPPKTDHLIGSPKALSCDKFAPKSWTCFSDIPALKAPNMEFVRGSVTAINPELKNAQILDLQSQETRHEPYDYLVAASGLRRVFPTVPQSLKRDEFLEEAKMHKECVQNAQDGIVIIGGGRFSLLRCSGKQIKANQNLLTEQVRWVSKWPRS